MRRRIILSSTLAILLLVGPVAPALASGPPEIGTFTLGVIEFETDPGEQFRTGNIMHIRNSVGQSGFTPLPWGNAISAVETIITAQVDITTGIGTSTSETEDVYDDGSVVLGAVQTDLEGLRSWTYLGPTFSFTLGSRAFTIENGQTYLGLYTNIITVKHGVSGQLKGLKTKEIATGVIVLLSPENPIPVVTLSYANGTYTWLK
jgi:hypothetical protein